MRYFLAVVTALLLAACSDTPTGTKAKAPEKPAEPITGRQAFQMTFPSARIWAPDAQPIRIRSLNLTDPKSHDGKAGAWEIVYVSQSRGRERSFSWSAVEDSPNLHQGVFGGPDQAWSGPGGQERPFLAAALKVDTPDALETAISKSAAYLSKKTARPQVSFLCELIPRYPDPVWRVFWGETVSAAQWSVFIDATTGDYKGM